MNLPQKACDFLAEHCRYYDEQRYPSARFTLVMALRAIEEKYALKYDYSSEECRHYIELYKSQLPEAEDR